MKKRKRGTGEEVESTEEGLKGKLERRKVVKSSRASADGDTSGITASTEIKQLVCRYCRATTFKDGKPFTKISDLSTHVRVECEEYPKFKEKRAVEAQREVPPATPYKGEPDANQILRRILDTFPGLPQDAVNACMHELGGVNWGSITSSAGKRTSCTDAEGK